MLEKMRMNVMKTICSLSLCGMTVRYRMRNEEIRRRVGVRVRVIGQIQKEKNFKHNL